MTVGSEGSSSGSAGAEKEEDDRRKLKRRLDRLPSRLLDYIDGVQFQVTVLFAVSFAVLLCLAVASHARTKLENDPVKLWTNDIFSDRNEGGVDDVRLDATDREGAMSIIQYYDSSSTKASQNNSILTRAELLRHYDLIKQLTQVKINFHEKQWDISKICAKISFPIPQPTNELTTQLLTQFMNYLNPCLITTPLDCFWDGASLLDATMNKLNIQVNITGRQLTWSNAVLRENMTELYKLYQMPVIFNFLQEVIKEYGLGDISYTEKRCLDRDNCESYAVPLKSDREVVEAFSQFASSSACPSFASKFLNSSFDTVLGSLMRNSSGHVTSAQQLHTVWHLMNKRQLYLKERYRQYRSSHWTEEAAAELLELFYRKFKAIVENANSVITDSRLMSSRRSSQTSQFMIFSARSSLRETVNFLEHNQIFVLLMVFAIMPLLLMASEKYFINSKNPLASTSAMQVVAIMLSLLPLLVPLTVKVPHVSFSPESVQVTVLLVLPIAYYVVLCERLLSHGCIATRRKCLTWPCFYGALSILPPLAVLFGLYSVDVIRSAIVSTAIFVFISPLLGIVVARSIRLTTAAAFAKYVKYRTRTSVKSLTGEEIENKSSRFASSKTGNSNSIKKLSEGHDSVTSQGDQVSNGATVLNDFKRDPSTTSASQSPGSSTGNKVSLYELGIPQSYIRPHCSKRRRHRHRHSYHRRSHVTALGSRVYDNIYSEEQNVGSQDEGDFKAIQFVNETAKESKDVNAEHKAEPVSSNPPSPKEGAEKGREEEQNRAAESPPKRKLTRTHKLHLKAPAASTSSSSSCCRYYYGHYCSNARWSRTWRKRRSRKLALKRRSTEMIKTKLFAYMLRWFSFFSSKQCQVSIACLFVACALLSCYIIPNAKTGLENETDLINSNSVAYSFVEMIQNNFKIPMTISVAIHSENVDLADPKMQRSLTNLDSEIREISIVDSTPDEELCWIKRFRQFLSDAESEMQRKADNSSKRNMRKLGDVLSKQSGSRYDKLVSTDGVIKPMSFDTFLTAWHSYDPKGVFNTQPGFRPMPPPIPVSYHKSGFLDFIPRADPVRLSFFHYKVSRLNELDDNHNVLHAISHLLTICAKFSQDGLKILPSGLILFPWSQFHDFNLVFFGVAALTVLTVPVLLYTVFRSMRLSTIMVTVNTGQLLLTVALCVSADVIFAPLCLMVMACLFTIQSSLSAVAAAYPLTTSSNVPMRTELLRQTGSFYCKLFVIAFITSAAQMICVVFIYFSAYGILSKQIFLCVTISVAVFWVVFAFVVPAVASHLTSYSVKLASRKVSTCQEDSVVASGSSDQSWYWFPYSSSWHEVAMSGPVAASSSSSSSRRHRRVGRHHPTSSGPMCAQSFLNSSNSFVLGAPDSSSHGQHDLSNNAYHMQMTTKRFNFLSGHGSLTRRQKMRLQRSYIRNQQFLAMAVAGNGGHTSSRHTHAAASKSPGHHQHPAVDRSASGGTSQKGFEPAVPSKPMLIRNLSNGSRSTAVPVTIIPSTCSTERKLFISPNNPHHSAADEEHECCPLASRLSSRHHLNGVEESSASSFYPISVTDAESDFLLMRSPSQNLCNESLNTENN